MMKTSTKLSVTVAASLLGVALAASGAYAATGALATRDAPGQVLQVSGVGPASDQATPTTHANAKVPSVAEPPHANAKVPSVAKPPHANARVRVPSVATTMPMAAGRLVVGQVARPAAQTLPAYHPAMPQTTASTPPAVPQPMMSPGANTSPGPMH
jgi:hypothetical protein